MYIDDSDEDYNYGKLEGVNSPTVVFIFDSDFYLTHDREGEQSNIHGGLDTLNLLVMLW